MISNCEKKIILSICNCFVVFIAKTKSEKKTCEPSPQNMNVLKNRLQNDHLIASISTRTLFNPFNPSDSIWSLWILDEITFKNPDLKG